MFTPFPHQQRFSDLWGQKKRVLNFDSCGTGKTLGVVHAIRTHWPDARVLVLGPLSILENAWGGDLAFGWPEASVAIATGSKIRKLRAYNGNAQWVITNHDSIKLIDAEQLARKFDVLVVDEADAFRNSSERTKALRNVSGHIPIMTMMTGTPTPKSVLDVFNLAYIVDYGERLGKNFSQFRKEMCHAYPIHGAPPGAMRYEDKAEANTKVMISLADIVTRTVLADVTELPSVIYRDIPVTMPKKLRTTYETLRKDCVLDIEGAEVNAVNAAAKINKLLQTVAGAVYEGDEWHDVHEDRHKLAVDLACETDHALVAFNWRHQREGLIRVARARNLEFAVIDGEVPQHERVQIVKDYQAGKYQILFAQPQSAGHGLTLTKANRIIWSSPTYRTDLYEQFNHRIIRTGQKQKTEILHIAATDSVEEIVYEKQQGKRGRMFDLLDAIAGMAKVA